MTSLAPAPCGVSRRKVAANVVIFSDRTIEYAKKHRIYRNYRNGLNRRTIREGGIYRVETVKKRGRDIISGAGVTFLR